MIPVSHLPWHTTRVDLVPLRFLPVEAVSSSEHEAWKRSQTHRLVKQEDYIIRRTPT